MILALYLRLSKEDGDLEDESNSITNQRYILHGYVEEKKELKSFQTEEYIDDGYSGRNFERPAVTRLFDDLKAGKIYGIIVKDFSRFGRNYIEVGNYLEKIFPLLDIRFIAVNNHFDSADYAGTIPDMDVAFENLMYDYFSEENSIKIKNDLIKKRMRGDFMATFAPYGYRKSPVNHNRILVDEEAAQVVKLIFEKYAETGVKAEVARYLNAHGILTPQEYARQKGIARHWKYEKEKKFWNGAIVGRILGNPVYIGNTVFHKKEVIEAGSRRTRCLPREEWKVCENTHEAIISRELYDRVNSRQRPERASPGYDSAVYCEGEKRRRGAKDSPVKSLIRCGGCRHHMIRRNRRNASYYCRHYYEVKSEGCCSHNVKEAELIEIVRKAICRQAAMAADLKELLKLHKKMAMEQKQQIEREKTIFREKIQRCREEGFTLYEKYKNEELTQNEFQEQRLKNQKAQELYQKQLDGFESREGQTALEDLDIFPLLQGKESMRELTKDTAMQLISEILVYDRKRVEIHFKFKDEWENLLETTGIDLLQKKF